MAGGTTLNQLAILPVDAIKIDRSLAAGLPHDSTSAKIVRAVAGLAADLGFLCMFTGIDRPEQLAALPPGVLVQGTLLGRPSTTPRDRPRRQSTRPAA